MHFETVSAADRERLRNLAMQVREAANAPQMKERAALWYRHNALKGERPLLVMEYQTFLNDVMPELHCQGEAARAMEAQMALSLMNERDIGDDKVISAVLEVPMTIHMRGFDLDYHVEHAVDSQGRDIGFAMRHEITDLREDLPKLRHSVYSADKQDTEQRIRLAQDVLGDILEVVPRNDSLAWYPMPSGKVVSLMGLETMMISMYDAPEEMHALMAFITEDIIRFMHWQQDEGLLTPNNGNHYAGAGSYGFSQELKPQPGAVKLSQMWGNMNSQETVCLSPAMYAEFIAPYYQRISEEFGLTYYGCCEPVHTMWDSVSKYANLRKVSISPWCDEGIMGERLRGLGTIYSRKPSPNFIGVGDTLDEDAFRAHIRETLTAARGCKLEIICRDIYTLGGDKSKPKRAIAIMRELIEEMW